jgi:predicted deacetylase
MSTKTIKITEQEKEMFDYLNDLRDSGATNMFGANHYLVDEFEVDKHEARKVLSKWMENFNADGYEHLL